MTNDIYQRLAGHLDTLPQRFPTSIGTGLERKVLRHIFSPEEAEMATQLKPKKDWIPVSTGDKKGFLIFCWYEVA
jgi:hypothetical protein